MKKFYNLGARNNFSRKFFFEKQMTKRHEKLPRRQRVKCMKFHTKCPENLALVHYIGDVG